MATHNIGFNKGTPYIYIYIAAEHLRLLFCPNNAVINRVVFSRQTHIDGVAEHLKQPKRLCVAKLMHESSLCAVV